MLKSAITKLSYPILIDGGLSNVLEGLGCNLNNELWVANVLTTNPEAIVKTHLAYLEAGAHIISTSSYQATIPGFMKLGYSEKEAEALILRSVELAEKAIQEFLKTNSPENRPLIAGSIGPYGAFLADGSEYRGNYNITDAELRTFHQRRVELLDNSSCDLLAFETIPSFREATVINELTLHCKTPSWISFSCKNENQINDSTLISKAASIFKNNKNIFAIGVNCTAPKYISTLITELKNSIVAKKILVYPNSGEIYDAESKTWSGTSDPLKFSEIGRQWIGLGAAIVGGCCRIGPDHIALLHKQISNAS